MQTIMTFNKILRNIAMKLHFKLIDTVKRVS